MRPPDKEIPEMTPLSESIPDPSVRRLSAYLRQLENLFAEGVERVSSRQLAEHVKGSDAQVRRDLALFGQFGRRGIGYEVEDLIQVIRTILGTRMQWNVVVVGAGQLCQAMLRYAGFKERGFTLVAAFDTDPHKIGKHAGPVVIRHIDEMGSIIKRHEVRLAILTVPAQAAQRMADRLVEAGVEGIMNFAPASLNVPPHVHLNQVDLTAYLEKLSFQVGSSRP
jgi:redox-sensing transcriptional repressor